MNRYKIKRKATTMRAIELKIVDTDIAKDLRTGDATGFRSDSNLFDPARHGVFPFYYKDHLRSILDAPMDPKAGAGLDEVRKSVTVLRKLKKIGHGEVMYLEEEEWEHLATKVKTVPLTFIETWIYDCAEDVLNAPKVSDEAVRDALNGKLAKV
jgi:hypothetical protein